MQVLARDGNSRWGSPSLNAGVGAPKTTSFEWKERYPDIYRLDGPGSPGLIDFNSA